MCSLFSPSEQPVSLLVGLADFVVLATYVASAKAGDNDDNTWSYPIIGEQPVRLLAEPEWVTVHCLTSFPVTVFRP